MQQRQGRRERQQHLLSLVSNVNEAAPVPGPASLAERAVAAARVVPAWNLLAGVTAAGAIALCAGPVSDVDVFWHVEVGAYALKGNSFPFPDPWAYTLPGAHWHSTAWLSEVVLAAVQRTMGWAGVVGLRALLTVLILLSLGRLLLRGRRNSWAPAVIYTVVALPIVFYVQERPQTASLLFLVWLAGILARGLQGQLPRRGRFVAVTWFWAWVHGLFVMAPGVLCLLAAGQLVQHGRAGRGNARNLLATAGCAFGIAALNPTGPRLLLAPLTVGAAARGTIAEWSGTSISVAASWGMFALLALLMAAYARSSEVPRDELLVVLSLGLFGLLAIRNAGPVSLLLAPVVLRRIQLTWRTDSTLTVRRSVSWLLTASLGVAALSSYTNHPAIGPTAPRTIADTLGAQPVPLRVLDDYNVSGFLISHGNGKVRLTVDGRADRYGGRFLQSYSDALTGGKDWSSFVTRLNPQVAVVGKDSLTRVLLEARLGWKVQLVDHQYALVVAPNLVLAPLP